MLLVCEFLADTGPPFIDDLDRFVSMPSSPVAARAILRRGGRAIGFFCYFIDF